MARRRRQARSARTSELGVPGAFEGETISRRRFMTRTTNTAGAIAAAAITLPALGFAVAPVFEHNPDVWENVGPLSRFTKSDYVPVTLTPISGAGESGNALAFVRMHDRRVDGPVRDRYDQVIAISSRCAHVGCPVRYVPAAQSFVCPCHGGVYNFIGKRVGGPPPRPLDRFYTLIQDGQVMIGPRYSLNNELRRFSPRPPGIPLDGIGQYLYPSSPSSPPAPPGASS